MLLSLDPGVRSPGAALFSCGVLVAATHITIKTLDACDGARWFDVAHQLAAWARQAAFGGDISSVVFERPFIYPRSKVDPNVLPGLSAISMGVVGLLGGRGLIVTSPLPREWTGQISKVCPSCGGKAKKKCPDCHGSAWETPRGRRIRSRLTPAELAVAHDQNDEIDAIGLGLWKLGRLELVRAFSNGRDS